MSQSYPQPTSNLNPRVYKQAHVAIVTAQWNHNITFALRDSAKATLDSLGVDYKCYEVPGAVELTHAAARLQLTRDYNAIIIFGCVVRGDTPHFDYVCQSVTQGTTMLNARGERCPVIFGVLTVEDMAQAEARVAGGSLHDKGIEAAEAALAMIDFHLNTRIR